VVFPLVETSFPLSIQNDASPVPGLFRLIFHQGGTLVLVPPGAHCDLRGKAAVVCACFGRSLVDPLALNGSSDRVVEVLSAVQAASVQLCGRDREEARELFAAMSREAAAQAPGFQGMLRLKLMESILLFVRARGAVHGAPAPTRLRFHPDEVMQFIQAHAADELSLTELAARYGLNPSYFSRLFSSRTGMTVVECINAARIQKSCQLLKRTEASIVEIALAVGYNNLSHFNRYFRRITGTSPREYRRTSRM
jgi:AraC-like DNA-binding protein